MAESLREMAPYIKSLAAPQAVTWLSSLLLQSIQVKGYLILITLGSADAVQWVEHLFGMHAAAGSIPSMV